MTVNIWKSYIRFKKWMLKLVSFLGSVGRALQRCRRGHGFKSRTGLNFYGLYFHCCLSDVYYCEDRFYTRPVWLYFSERAYQLVKYPETLMNCSPAKRLITGRRRGTTPQTKGCNFTTHDSGYTSIKIHITSFFTKSRLTVGRMNVGVRMIIQLILCKNVRSM